MNFNLKIAKYNIKNSKKSILCSSKYTVYEKKVRHIKFLNKAINNILQINPFVILYTYTDNINFTINPFIDKQQFLVSNLKFSDNKRRIIDHFNLNQYISKTNLLVKNTCHLTFKQQASNTIKHNSKLTSVDNFEDYVLGIKKKYMQYFIKTRFCLFFFQNYLVKTTKKSNDFLTNFEISFKKSFVFDLFNLLNIIHFINFHFFFFIRKKNVSNLSLTKKSI